MVRNTTRGIAAFVLAVLMVAAHRPAVAAGPFGGPTVVIEPGDIIALRGPNIRNPLGPSSVYAPPVVPGPPPASTLQRDLERDLRRLPSRTAARPELPIPTMRLERDRERAAAALDAFRTMRPNDPATPLLERQLDRIERPTDLGQ